MSYHSNAKIFLSAERGLAESEWFRSFRTFNFGKYFNEHKTPFGNLYVVNDDSIAGGQSLKMTVEYNSYIFLLPVVGAIEYKDTLGHETVINAGELQLMYLNEGTAFGISNPYEKDLVNFLQVRIKSPAGIVESAPLITKFNIEEEKNRLLSTGDSPSLREGLPNFYIGQFDGRKEAFLPVNKHSDLFVFVIEGAFEVQGRLLHPRDGLALWNLYEPVELEALSNEAIVIMIQL